MWKVGLVVAAAAPLLACGRQPDGPLLEGSVRGHEFSVKNAVFYPVYDWNSVFLYTGDEEDICAVLNDQRKPSHQVNLLSVSLANETAFDPTTGVGQLEPLVPGKYVQCIKPGPGPGCAPGLYSSAQALWTSDFDCSDIGAMGSTDAEVLLETFGGNEEGSHLVASVKLTFPFGDHLSGRIDATFCYALRFPACRP